jgi:hypothetical protein
MDDIELGRVEGITLNPTTFPLPAHTSDWMALRLFDEVVDGERTLDDAAEESRCCVGTMVRFYRLVDEATAP